MSALVLDNLKLVEQCAWKLGLRPCSSKKRNWQKSELWDDAVQEGRIGLMRAAERYEPARDVPFRAYARPFVTGAIKDCLSRDSGVTEPVYRVKARAAKSAKDVDGNARSKALCVSLTPIDPGAEDREPEDGIGGLSGEREETEMLRTLDRARVLEAVEGLPPKYRAAARAMVRGLNPTDYAKRAGIPRQTASDHYQAARAALAKTFN